MPEQRLVGQVIIVFITINTIIIVDVIIVTITIKITIANTMIVTILMIRVERQGRDLMERQKEVSKDSSKLGKEEVSSNNQMME